MLNKEPEDTKGDTGDKISKSAAPAWNKLKSKVGFISSKKKRKTMNFHSVL